MSGARPFGLLRRSNWRRSVLLRAQPVKAETVPRWSTPAGDTRSLLDGDGDADALFLTDGDGDGDGDGDTRSDRDGDRDGDALSGKPRASLGQVWK